MADAPISEELTTLRKRARRRLVGAIALVLIALVVLWTVMDDKPPQGFPNTPISIVSSTPGLTTNPILKPDERKTDERATPPATPNGLAANSVASTPAIEPVKPPVAPPAQIVAPAAVEPVHTIPAEPVPEPKPAPKPKPEKPLVEKKPEGKPPAEKKPEIAKPAHVDPKKILDDAPQEVAIAKHADTAGEPAHSRFFLQVGAFADASKVDSLKAKIGAAGLSPLAEPITTPKGELVRLRVGPYTSRDAAEKAHGKLAAAGVTSQIVGK